MSILHEAADHSRNTAMVSVNFAYFGNYMCGFAGFLITDACNVDCHAPISLSAVATRMADTIAHRGPDDSGVWADADAGVALAHRRLSIVELTPAGHQPMVSACRRYVIAFNGEIYNHLDLRQDLENIPSPQKEGGNIAWQGHSDTETLLACFAAWGVERTIEAAVGMFAIALWDRKSCTLTLARDRFGEKPLYYGWVNGSFVFGSELKALRAFPGFANAVCRQALAQYMRFMYVPAPRSIYQNIYKLEPGCLLFVVGTPPGHPPSQLLRPDAQFGSLRLQSYWSLGPAVKQGAQHPINDESEALERLQFKLREAVALQSLADVPLGAFLSGGVDSSLIVALMQQQAREGGGQPVKTFTVGFEEAGFDESPHARAVAQHLGTEHHEIFVSSAETHAVIAQLPVMYDEPFADSSQIPTHLVCKAARQHVTVALSGDAGDELFGGYNRYFWGPRLWNKVSWMPFELRRAVGASLQALPVPGYDALGRGLNYMHAGSGGVDRLGDKVHKLAQCLGVVQNIDDLYLTLVSAWHDLAHLVRCPNEAGGELASRFSDPLPDSALASAPERMMWRDIHTYLPDDILCKVDRAAMATSLEIRAPFLDHRVAELAWQLPLQMKIRDNQGKWALRQILYRHVPRELIERPKAGFAIPVGKWLRGPLRAWAEALLDEHRLQREGYLHPQPIRQAWAQHLSGRYDHTSKLWCVLMFQAWLEGNC